MDPHAQRTSLYAISLNEVENCLKIVSENLEGEELPRVTEEVKQLYMSYKQLHFEWIQNNNAIDKVRRKVQENSKDIDIKDVAQLIQMYKKEDKTTSKSLKEVAEEIRKKMHVDSSSDELISHSQNSIIDPISKKIMTNPVKNVYCSHTYDLDSITALLNSERGSDVKCPYPGCSNNLSISRDHLVVDEEILKVVKKARQC